MTLYLKFVHFKVILNVNSSYLLYETAENYIIRNEFNSYPDIDIRYQVFYIYENIDKIKKNLDV